MMNFVQECHTSKSALLCHSETPSGHHLNQHHQDYIWHTEYSTSLKLISLANLISKGKYDCLRTITTETIFTQRFYLILYPKFQSMTAADNRLII